MNSSHRPIKSLGQNFLNDARIQQKIVKSCDLNEKDTVIEIGPGQGALTRQLILFVKKLIAVEKDRNLIATIQQQLEGSSHEVIHADFLKWDMSALPDELIVVGNIPYYISTPIIEKIIKDKNKIKKVFLTVQLEFGQRLAAQPGNKEYGSLSCFVQYYFDVKILFKISKGSFHPVPKVDSCFLSLIPKSKEKLKAKDEVKLFKFIQTSFMQRRKTLINSIKGLVDAKQLEEELHRLKLDAQVRPEQISLLNYIELSNKLMI